MVEGCGILKETLKSLFVVVVCVCAVLATLVVVSEGNKDKDTVSTDTMEETQDPTSGEDDSGSDDEELDMPTAFPETNPPEDDAETVPPIETAQGEVYPLAKNTSSRIGRFGLLPATPVAIVKQRTASKVKFDTCTVAFSLPGKGRGKNPWAITAGHCGKVGQKVYTLPTGSTFNSAVFVGTVRAVSEPDSSRGTSDWSAIRLNPKAKMPNHRTKIPMQLDTYPRKQDERLCKNGNTTGFNCGAKGKDNVSTELKSVDKTTGALKTYHASMSQVHLCALPGDSGSPIFDHDGIVGVLSSTSASKKEVASGKCKTTSLAYYTPIGEVVEQIRKKVPSIVF